MIVAVDEQICPVFEGNLGLILWYGIRRDGSAAVVVVFEHAGRGFESCHYRSTSPLRSSPLAAVPFPINDVPY